MERIEALKRFTATLLLVAIAVATVAPAAEANHQRWRRHRGGRSCAPVVRRYVAPARVIEVRRSSCDVPALAGFFGGLAVGAILSAASERDDRCARPSEPAYSYYDPYCRETFASLEIYRSHLRYHPHPGYVRVLDSGTGECVRTYNYCHGGWEAVDDRDGWDDED